MRIKTIHGVLTAVCLGISLPLYAQQGVAPNTGFFEGELKVRLFYRSFKTEQPRGAIVLVHGFGEHSGRYLGMAEHFLNQGLNVYALDHRGHGRSEGPRWNPERFEYYVEDLKTFIEDIKLKEGVDRVFMLGHSLGGEIALSYALTYPEDLKSLVVSGPGVGMYLSIPGLGRTVVNASAARALVPLLDGMARLLPDAPLPGTQIDPALLNHDQANTQAYASDPLVCHEPMKLRFAAESGKAMIRIWDDVLHFRTPVLILQGEDDVIVPPSEVRRLYEALGIQDKAFIMYEGFYHEIFNELGKERVYEDVDAWLLPRLQELKTF